MKNAKLVCFRSRVLLQDWITFKALALEDRSWIMNQIAEEKYGRLLSQLINSCRTFGFLYEVVTLIFDKAILEPTFCPMYAKLCSDLNGMLPETVDGKINTLKRILLNLCQQLFEGGDVHSEELRKMNAPHQKAERKEMERLSNIRALGNLRLIGELFKQKMVTVKIAHVIVQNLLGDDEKMCPTEENVEAVCLFLKTIGKELDDGSEINDRHFRHLKNLSNHPQLAMRLRYMIRNVIYLRSNGWISRPEVVKEKTTTEVYSES